MSRGRLAFKESDLARAMRAASKAVPGAFHVRIERGSGDIVILPGAGPVAQGAAPKPAEDLDAELEAWRAGRGES